MGRASAVAKPWKSRAFRQILHDLRSAGRVRRCRSWIAGRLIPDSRRVSIGARTTTESAGNKDPVTFVDHIWSPPPIRRRKLYCLDEHGALTAPEMLVFGTSAHRNGGGASSAIGTAWLSRRALAKRKRFSMHWRGIWQFETWTVSPAGDVR